MCGIQILALVKMIERASENDVIVIPGGPSFFRINLGGDKQLKCRKQSHQPIYNEPKPGSLNGSDEIFWEFQHLSKSKQ